MILKKILFQNKLLPKGLLGRSLLILILPLVLLQAVLGFAFYEYHIEDKLIESAHRFSSEISYIKKIYEKNPHSKQLFTDTLKDFSASLGHDYSLIHKKDSMYGIIDSYPGTFANRFWHFLSQYQKNIMVTHSGKGTYFITTPLKNNDVLLLTVEGKEILSSKWHFLPVWSLVTAIISALIAIVFLKNQIRPIIRLSQALEAFGRGDNDYVFHPSGAVEIRKAGIEFLKMRRRLNEYITSRTMMLAGVSHDLRTILTRFKLELSFMAVDESTQNLKTDVQHMTAVLDAYFNFINSTQTEEAILTDIPYELQQIIDRHKHTSQEIIIQSNIASPVVIRKNGFLRCVINLLSNAQRYGTLIHIHTELKETKQGKYIIFVIEDNGCGVPTENYEKIFAPFFTDNTSRTLSKNYGEQIGLGLSIVRNIARTKGGDVIPSHSESLGGLKITLTYFLE